MSFFGDLIDSFTGASARRDIQQGKTEANSQLDTGLAAGNQFYDKAASNLDPYVKGGNAFYSKYSDLMGLNGQDAQAQAQGAYLNDPIQKAILDRLQRSNQRNYTGQGMGNSGAAMGSLSNTLYANYNDWRNQYGAQGQQGMQAAGAQSGVYGQQGDAQITVANQKAGVDVGAANATAASRNTPWNNLIGLAGAAGKFYKAA